MFTFYPMFAHLHIEKQKKENQANKYSSLASLNNSTNEIVRGKVSLNPNILKELKLKNSNQGHSI